MGDPVPSQKTNTQCTHGKCPNIYMIWVPQIKYLPKNDQNRPSPNLQKTNSVNCQVKDDSKIFLKHFFTVASLIRHIARNVTPFHQSYHLYPIKI